MSEPRQSPTVVVGIATYNRAQVLPKAIRSALDQSYQPLRVVVIDDASTDETPTVRDAFPMTDWSRVEARQGQVRARNRMMLGADAEFYASLDDDAWFIAGDEIAIAVDFLDRHPHAAIIAFDILTADRPEQNPRGKYTFEACFIGCGHVARLSAVREVGGYTEFPGIYGAEETDLSLKLIDAGYDIVKLSGVHVWHDKSPSGRDSLRQHRSGVCNDLAVAMRRAPLHLLIPIIIWKLLWHIVFGIRKGLLRPCLEGIADFTQVSGEIWGTRNPVRRASIRTFRRLTKAPRPLVD